METLSKPTNYLEYYLMIFMKEEYSIGKWKNRSAWIAINFLIEMPPMNKKIRNWPLEKNIMIIAKLISKNMRNFGTVSPIQTSMTAFFSS